ncbi:MAG: GNAT family N-acetyltransferase [Solirubrobacteraceae bacterium]
MSGTAPPRLSFSVRPAAHGDVPAVVAAVQELLRELGGTPPPTDAMRDAARVLLDTPLAGALLVAEADGATVGAQADGGAAGVEANGGAHGAAADSGAAGAETSLAVIGVLGVSWQTAIHAAGPYVLIQDLWVHPDWRGRGVGGGLLEALYALAHEREITRAEVGLPPARFAGLPATEAFYRDQGFAPLGARMRRVLP